MKKFKLMISSMLLLATTVLTGCKGFKLNGTIKLGFEDLGIEAVPRDYTVTWLDADGTELEKDKELYNGDTAFYNGKLPEKEGFVFTGFDNASINNVGKYYVTIVGSNITCVAQYTTIEQETPTEIATETES